MNPQTKIHLLFCIVFLLSCSSSKQKQQLMESANRLQRQNAIALGENKRLESELERLLSADYFDERYEYLKPSIRRYIENTNRFSETISGAVSSTNNKNSAFLVNQYEALQKSYKFLKQKIVDSFTYIKFDTNTFMEFNEKAFTKKYLDAHDSTDDRLQLLFLQADAISNEAYFTEAILVAISPSGSCCFDFIRAIGTTDKLIYKSGEKLKLTATLAKSYSARKGYAIVNGKRFEIDGGVLEYSKKITEKPGLHKLSFEIIITKNGKIESYPAVVTYMVE